MKRFLRFINPDFASENELKEEADEYAQVYYFSKGMIIGVLVGVLGNFFVNIIWDDLMPLFPVEWQLVIKVTSGLILIVLLFYLYKILRDSAKYELLLRKELVGRQQSNRKSKT